MAIFCSKKLTTTHSLKLNELLKEEREKRSWTREQAQFRTTIPLKYIESLEEEHYNLLPPGRIHRLAYIREYAETLGLNPEICIQQFIKEGGFENSISTIPPKKKFSFLAFPSISIFLRNIVVGGVIMLFIGYLGWQVRGILEPPLLEIFTPTDGSISKDAHVAIQGKTQPESKLTINGEVIEVNDKGNFDVGLDLNQGLNTLTISATKKHGKTTTRIVNVIVKQNTFTVGNQSTTGG